MDVPGLSPAVLTMLLSAAARRCSLYAAIAYSIRVSIVIGPGFTQALALELAVVICTCVRIGVGDGATGGGGSSTRSPALQFG